MTRRKFLALLGATLMAASRSALSQSDSRTYRVALFSPSVPVIDGSPFGALLIRDRLAGDRALRVASTMMSWNFASKTLTCVWSL
jgi:hypothetical protein